MRSLLLVNFLFLPSLASAEPWQAPTTQAAVGHAGDSWKADVLKTLEIDIGAAGVDGARNIAVVVDRNALARDVPTLQEHGALSNSITADQVQKRPASYSNALTLLLTSYAVRNLYGARQDLGVTRWKVVLSPAFGDIAQVRREMFAFTFDRPRYDSIDWDRLAFTDFPRAANAFSYNLRFTLEMSHEVDGSIDED